MATDLELGDLPTDISESYLPYQPTLRQRQKAYAFSKSCYVHHVKFSGDINPDEIHISAKVYRRKSESPHSVNMTINTCTKTLTEGHCMCKAGNSKLSRDDISNLQNLKDCPISYLTQSSEKMVDTTYGPQYIGSGLSYHAPLMNPVKPPNEGDYPCGNLDFPTKLDDNIIPAIVKENQNKWFHLSISFERSRKLEKDTRNQSDSEVWMLERKQRVTASNF